MLKKIIEKHKENIYLISRVLIGLLFLQHGIQKLFGLLGGKQVELISLIGLAGIIEFFGGVMIVLGLFTRFAAFIGIVDMIGAWFKGHIANGWIPIINKGELAVLYLAVFLLILIIGSGKLSLDKKLRNIE